MPNAGARYPIRRTAMLEKLPDVVGHALRGQRAGLDKTAFQAVDLRAGMAAITVDEPRVRRPRADPGALHGRRRRACRRRCNGPACRPTAASVAADRRRRRRADAAAARARDRRRPAGAATARSPRARCRAPTTTAAASGSAATRTCRRAGCRPIRRPATACIATRSRCSRSRPGATFDGDAGSRRGARGDPRARPGERLPDRHLRAARHRRSARRSSEARGDRRDAAAGA